MIQRYSLLFFLQFFITYSFAQFKVTGTVKDAAGELIPFGAVYIKNTTKGTSANVEGQYSLTLEKGHYTLVFKAIGFKALEKSINLTENTILNVSLSEEAYTLQDVVIRPGAEDLAYEMIRKTIRKRKAHLTEVEEFTCEVYIKGLQKLLAAPKKFLGQDIQKYANEMGLDSNRSGIVYLSESQSKYSFKQPNSVHEEMISSKVSGSNRAFSFNRASDMKLNFYENFQDWEDLSLRPLVSPISDNAMFYYNYKFLGVTTENGRTVNKIQVIPKRSTDPVYRGVIYIIEDEWRLYDIDLYLTKEANINFVDTLKIRQQFIPVAKDVYMPSSVTFDFKGGVFGFKFGGYFIAIYKDYDIVTKRTKKDYAEVMRITKQVNKKDSAYWESARPIPLTEEEAKDYTKKEALATKRESKPYLDSLDKANNKFKIKDFVIGRGYSFRNRYEKEYYHITSLKDAIFYNTVEGFGFNYGATYRKVIDSISNRSISLSTKLRYGFSSKKFYPAAGISIPAGQYTLSMAAGGDVLDLNNQAFQGQLGNSLNSLIFEKNNLKLYEKKYAQIGLSGRVVAGLTGSISAEYSNRKALLNTTSYSFRDVKNREFTSNNPFDPANNTLLFPENQAFKISARLNYNFSNKYVTYPQGKFYTGSKYPRLTVGYTKGIKEVFGSDVDYDLLFAELAKNDIKLGFYGKFSFMAGAGTFLNNNSVNFTDYKHFTGNVGTLFTERNNLFLFLDFYNFSTDRQYVELHANHNFSGFLLNKIPLIRKLKLQEVIGANYLSTPVIGNYTEFYFGLHYLGFKAYYGYSFQEGKKMDNGFKIGLGF